jgi:hypothetical protein
VAVEPLSEEFRGMITDSTAGRQKTAAEQEIEKSKKIKKELEGAEQFLKVEHDMCACVTYDEVGEEDGEARIMKLAMAELELEVALDSGTVAHVANPSHLPANAVVIPNETGRHFQGANESHIENYGTCRTRLQDQKTHVVADCGWSVAEVARPLHAVCNHTGTVEEPHGIVGKPAKDRKPLYAVRPRRGPFRS